MRAARSAAPLAILSVFGDLKQHRPDAFRVYTRFETVTARWPSGIKETGRPVSLME